MIRALRITMIVLVLVLIVPLAHANSGWWQFTHDDPEVRVLMSIAPLAPDVGQDVNMVFSITDGEEFLKGPISARVTVIKNGKPLIETPWRKVSGGIHSEKITFNSDGFQEVQLEMDINGRKTYVDYPISVHPSGTLSSISEQSNDPIMLVLTILLLFIGGYGLGRLLKSGIRRIKKR